ncbi:MAG: sugar ABC transporter permease [Actinomycetes bacterium]|jgi:multiple sugar transport system permease protein
MSTLTKPVVRKRSADTRKMIKALALLTPAAIMVCIFIYYPVIRTILMAFQNYKLFDQSNIGYSGFNNFRGVFHDSNFTHILKNTLLWVGVSLFFQFTIGFGLALLMKKKFRFIGIYQGIIFIPWALAGFLMGLVWKWIFDDNLGVMNDLLLKLGIIHERIPWLSNPSWAMAAVIIANIWYGVTFFVIMILAALQGVPGEILEAAELDGANRVQTLFQVIIPYIRATLILIVLLRIMWITNFPDIIFGMTSGGPAGGTHILSSWLIEKITYDQDWGAGAAVGILILGILFVFSFFYLLATRLEKDSGV